MKYIFSCVFVFLSFPIFSQIVFIEDTKESDEKGWSGAIELEYDYNKSTEIDMEFINSSFLQWNNETWTVFLLNEIDFNRAGDKDFANNSLQHFRISYHVKDNYAIESFVQNQHDLVHNIENRGLAGLGVRTKLPVLDIIGISAFFEYEELVDSLSNEDVRLSVYNQLSFNISEKIKFSNSVYYQPKTEDFSDYRLALEASISIPLSKKLFFTNSFSLAHDTHPANDIPNTTYQIKNSLKYEF